jgi:hypothetical protein
VSNRDHLAFVAAELKHQNREGIMPETQLTITAEEREVLASLLGEALKQTRVEEHRTKNLSYREHIVQKDKLLESLLVKLAAAPQ